MREVAEPEEPDELEPDRRPPGGTRTTAVLTVLAALFLGWAALPIVGLDTRAATAALVALIPYAVPAGAVLTLLALLLRRWLTTLAVCLATVVLAFSVVPRAIPDAPAPTQGTPLRVLSANLYGGGGDAERIVDLVRRNRIDVLSLQELTPRAVAAMDRAGLAQLMPHRVFDVEADTSGSGIASRHPLRRLDLVPPTTMHQPSARVELPRGRDIEFVAAHPVIPVGRDTIGDWSREIGVLPAPANEPDEVPRVVAGDFNATLDHTPLKAQLGRGYRDAAAITGGGLAPTWPVDRGVPGPLVTLDHVLVSGGIAVQDYRTFDVAGSDHRAVMAHLVVP